MRVLLSTYGSRGDVEPMAALAVQLRESGAQVRVCAPPDEEFAEVLDRIGVPMVPFARPWRSWQRPSTPREVTERVGQFINAQYETLAAEAEHCDMLVATGMSHFVARSAAEKAGVPHRFALFCASMLDAPRRDAVIPGVRVQAAAVAGAIRTDGAATAATLLLDAVRRERPEVSA